MKVMIAGKTTDLAKLDIVGSGGEGLVVKTTLTGFGQMAIKVYHQPTLERSRKLDAFFKHRWNIPTEKVALPQIPVYDSTGSMIVGFGMPYLGTGFEEIALLPNRKKRIDLGIDNRLVTQIFLDGHKTLEKIHTAGLVVGDLNDRNVLFKDTEMLWIDVDAWQFGTFPCPVATLEFLDPALYGKDLSKRPVFESNHDWYSFAVMFFRSLLLVHPYGGVHQQYKTLPARATSHVTALDPSVKYPKIGLSPDILSDDLLEEFFKVFTKNKRGVFPTSLMLEYLQGLTECKNCHAFYPANRASCPVCSQKTLVVITTPVTDDKGINVQRLFTTKGNIAYTKVQGNKIYVIEHIQKHAWLHVIDQGRDLFRIHLGNALPGIRYEVAGSMLVMSQNHTTDLKIIDINHRKANQFHQSVTEIFEPSRQAVFQVTQNKVVRIVNGNIMSIEKDYERIIERYIRNGIPNQTWFATNKETERLQLFGFVQVLRDRIYWYCLDKKHFEPKIPTLNANEGLVDISVEFSGDTALLRRKTIQNGVEYLRSSIVDGNGEVTYSNIVKMTDHPVDSIHGQVFSGGVLLHATDNGILQERITSSVFKYFDQTEPYVKGGDELHKFGNGLLIAGSNNITYIELHS